MSMGRIADNTGRGIQHRLMHNRKENLMAETIVHYIKDHVYTLFIIAVLVTSFGYIALHYEQLFFRE